MAALGAKIFGEVTRPTSQPGRRVYRLFMEKPLEKDPQFTQYYPKHIEITSLMKRLRALGLYRYLLKYFFIYLFSNIHKSQSAMHNTEEKPIWKSLKLSKGLIFKSCAEKAISCAEFKFVVPL